LGRGLAGGSIAGWPSNRMAPVVAPVVALVVAPVVALVVAPVVAPVVALVGCGPILGCGPASTSALCRGCLGLSIGGLPPGSVDSVKCRMV